MENDSASIPSIELKDQIHLEVFPNRTATILVKRYENRRLKMKEIDCTADVDLPGCFKTCPSSNLNLDALSIDKVSTVYIPMEFTWVNDDETESLVRKLVRSKNGRYPSNVELDFFEFEYKRRNLEINYDQDIKVVKETSSINLLLEMHSADYAPNPQVSTVHESERRNVIRVDHTGSDSTNEQFLYGLYYDIGLEKIPVGDKPTQTCKIRARSDKPFNSCVITKEAKEQKPLEAKCERCSRTFPCSKLKQHQQTSKCRKPFKCKICKQLFMLGTDFRDHIKNRICVALYFKICKRKQKPLSKCKQKPLSECKQKPLIKCERCNKSFLGYKALERHQQTLKCSKPFKCPVCYNRFTLKTELDDHMKTHDVSHPYLCVFCGESFNKEYKLKDHLFKHTGIPHYQCPECKEKYNSRLALDRHRAKAHKKIKKCPHCPNEYALKSSLKNHITLKHTNEGFKCDQCERRFATKAFLNFHKKTHELKNYSCDHCDKTFTIAKNLQRHTSRRHSEPKPYHACPVCSRQFSELSNMKRHLAMHSGVKNFVCAFCDKGFSQKGTLINHMATQHPEKTDARPPKPYKPRPGIKRKVVYKKVECNLCNKMICRNLLADHMNVHADVKPYQCPTCDKRYSTRLGLYKHSLVHKEEKYHCDVCGYRTVYKQSLQIHARSHTGELPYKCQFCGTQYSNMSNCKRHEKICAPKYSAEIE